MVAALYATVEAASVFFAHKPGVRVQQDDSGPPVSKGRRVFKAETRISSRLAGMVYENVLL